MIQAFVTSIKGPTLRQSLASVGSPTGYIRGLSVDALFEGGRMAVGAVSVSYLLSTGLPISNIAYLKIIQSVVLMLGELPTGLFADAHGHRKSLIAATVCTIAGLLLFSTSSHFFAFVIAEIMTALALCFWSGAYEAYAIKTADLKRKEGLMDQYFHQNQSLNNFSVLLLGWTGGYLATVDYRISYFLAILLVGASFILLFKSPPEESSQKTIRDSTFRGWYKQIRIQLKETYETGVKNPALWPFFFANILIQFSIQPLLHYWQPAFQELLGPSSPTDLGSVFATYCGLSVLASMGFSKISRFGWSRSPAMTVALFSLFAVFYFLFSKSTSFGAALVSFALVQAILSLARTSLNVRLNEIIPDQNRASILSAVGLVSRVGMMIALFLIGLHLKEKSSVFATFEVFSYGTIAALCIVILGIAYRSRTPNRKKV